MFLVLSLSAFRHLEAFNHVHIIRTAQRIRFCAHQTASMRVLHPQPQTTSVAARLPPAPAPAPSATRRCLLSLVPAGLVLALTAPPSSSASTSATLSYVPASIDPSLTPDSTTYDASDERLRRAGRLIQEALNAPTVEDEERTWTRIIEEFSGVEAVWRDDVVGRAYGNRGNARSRQGKVDEALKDYDESIRICPWSVDPVLVRSVWLVGGAVHTLTC